MWRATALGWLAATLLLAAPAAGQGCGRPPCGGGGGPPPPELSVFPVQVVAASPAPADFDAGWIEGPPLVLAVSTNGQWEIVASATPNGAGKPLGDLWWQIDGRTQWQPWAGGEQWIAGGNGSETLELRLRWALSWAADPPGTSTVELELTARRP